MRLPYAGLVVRADGTTDPASLTRAVATVTADGITDVLVLAHGWNETPLAALRLYTDLTDQVMTLAGQRPAISQRFAAVGIIWPSLPWADEAHSGGGAAAVAGDETMLLHEAIRSGIEDPATRAALQDHAAHLDTPTGRAAFVATLRSSLPPAEQLSDDDALPSVLHHGDAEELFRAAAGAAPDALPGMPDDLEDDELLGGGAGFHLHLPSLSPREIARQLVNLTSYYTMKDRAGKVGTGAVGQLLTALHAAPSSPVLHLAGHSFGARVVSSAATATHVPVHSIGLLQGAFSHLGFAPTSPAHKPGAFRQALTTNVTGPIIVTHTHRDLAVTLAYSIASRLARQSGDAFGGGRDDPYGGLGANGAVDTPEAIDTTPLSPAEFRYTLTPRRIHNLKADAFIAGHSDIRGPEVANALLQAMTTPAG
jgi:hypothetical protein